MKRPSKVSKKTKNEPALDQAQIVQAALALLDEVGFDGLTMRSLADKLGIKAASLYWHVHDKQELLGLLADEICAPMREPDRTLPWRERLQEMAYEYRRILLAHRDAARVFAGGGAPSGPNQLRLSEIVLRALLDAGFSHRDAAYAGLLVNDFVTMFVAEETRYKSRDAGEGQDADAGGGNWRQVLASGEYPSLAALTPYLAEPNVEERFRFGIEILRTGLEARLAKGGSGST